MPDVTDYLALGRDELFTSRLDGPDSIHTAVQGTFTNPTLSVEIVDARLAAVRDFCNAQIANLHTAPGQGRAWACQSVLNILNGNIDDQLGDDHG